MSRVWHLIFIVTTILFVFGTLMLQIGYEVRHTFFSHRIRHEKNMPCNIGPLHNFVIYDKTGFERKKLYLGMLNDFRN